MNIISSIHFNNFVLGCYLSGSLRTPFHAWLKLKKPFLATCEVCVHFYFFFCGYFSSITGRKNFHSFAATRALHLQRNSKNLQRTSPISPSCTNTCVWAVPTSSIHVSVVKKHAFQLILFHANCCFSHNLLNMHSLGRNIMLSYCSDKITRRLVLLFWNICQEKNELTLDFQQ